MPITHPATCHAAPAANAAGRIDRLFPLALAAYFTLHVIIRVTQQGALELDEAEQVFYAQQLKLGYGSQPPLYAWLQWLAFQLAGVNHVALSLVKNALLFGLYWSVYRTGRLLLGSLPAAAVTASFVLIVPLGWEAQIDRTHSILASTLAAATLWAYFALLGAPRRTALRLLLGVLAGLGMQSKYNFAIFAVGLVGASLAVREHRRAIWTRDLWLSIAAAVVVLLPHGVWFVQQWQAATGETLVKMTAGHTAYADAVTSGALQLLASIISFITPLWIAVVLAFKGGATSRVRTPEARFLLWMIAIGMTVVTLLVAAGQLAEIKSRWLQPLLFALPLAACAAFPPRDAQAYRSMLLIACTTAFTITLMLAARPALQLALGKVPRLYQPYGELGRQVRDRFPHVAAVAVPNADVGGNLGFALRGSPQVIPYRELCTAQGTVLVLAFEETDLLPVLRQCGQVGERGRLVARSPFRRQEPLGFHYALTETFAPHDGRR